MLTYATVAHTESPVTACHKVDWSQFAHMVTNHTVSETKAGSGWMPAAIDPGPRKGDRVAFWSCLVLDIEASAETLPSGLKRVTGPLPPPMDELATELELRGWDAALATSHSHEGPAEAGTLGPRYRVALRTDRPVKPEEIKPLAMHVADTLGVGDCVDTSCMEPARLFYDARVPHDRQALAQSAIIEGEALNVDALLSEAIAVSAPIRRKAGGSTGSVIDAFNQQADFASIIEPHGYEPRGRNRCMWPSSSTRVAGVVQVPRTGRLFSHHPNDPLYTGGPGGGAHDTFSAWCILKHDGNVPKAVKTAARLLGMDKPKAPQSLAEFMALPQQEGTPEAPPDEPVKDAGDETRNAPPVTATAAPKAPPQGFAFVQAGELLGNPQPVRYLVDELVEAQSLALLFAAPSSGKSFFALSWAASIATGTPWMGREVEAGPVFYLAGEGHAGLSRRLKAWEEHHGVSLADAPLFVSKVPASLMDVASAASVVRAIETLQLVHGQPALIVIDTFARNMGAGDENSNADIGLFVNHIDQMRLTLGCAVLLVHHTGHMEKDRARGGSALNAAMDASFQLEKKVGDTIELTQRKAKESELSKPLLFELKQVTLPGWLDSKGREMLSAVLVEKDSGQAERMREKPLTPTQQQGIDSFYRAAVEHGIESESGQLTGVHLETWRQEFYRTSTADNTDAKKVAFQRARKDLVRLGRLTVTDDTYWVDVFDIGLTCAHLARGFKPARQEVENQPTEHGT
jgi:hypothetical protein